MSTQTRPMSTTTRPKVKRITPDEFRRMQRDIGLTNSAMAERIGVTRGTIQKWRAGNVKIPVATGEFMRFLAGSK